MIVRPRRATWHINHERGIAAEAILPRSVDPGERRAGKSRSLPKSLREEPSDALSQFLERLARSRIKCVVYALVRRWFDPHPQCPVEPALDDGDAPKSSQQTLPSGRPASQTWVPWSPCSTSAALRPAGDHNRTERQGALRRRGAGTGLGGFGAGVGAEPASVRRVAIMSSIAAIGSTWSAGSARELPSAGFAIASGWSEPRRAGVARHE
jgi:hypothetical protein